MAITSKFYTGSVDHVEWSKGAPEVGASFYGVEGLGDWQPTVVPNVDRTVRIGTGTAWGRGVRDVKDTVSDVPIPSVTTGTRWDLIVARRTWGTSTTSVALVTGTAAKGIPAGRLVGPGVVDDQPLALAKVTAGSATITELVDLRAFGGGAGGLQVLDKLALQYLKFPGAMVYAGTEVFVFPAGATEWVKIHNFGGIQLFGAGSALVGDTGTMIADKSPFLVQAGTFVRTSDNSGYSRYSFPVPFPNGLLTIQLTAGDDWSNGRVAFFNLAGRPDIFGSAGFGNKNEFVYVMQGSDGAGNNWGKVANRVHRINYTAIGF